MKKLTSTLKAIGRSILIPVLALAVISVSSCKKETSGRPQNVPVSMDTKAKAAKLRASTTKALKDFIIIFNPSNQQAGNGGGSNNWSVVGTNVTSYTTPNANVYQWTDPSSGTQFTLSQSTGGAGGGLGQLAYNGKSFDYNFVLSIKASSTDPQWSGFLNGRDLRGAVAIDGQLTNNTFSLKNLAIFLVMTTGGSGTYKFIDWDATSIGGGDGIGELLDFSDVTNNTLAGMDNAHFYITSDGHINVSDQSFEMASDAKVTDVVTGGEYSISGSLMFE